MRKGPKAWLRYTLDGRRYSVPLKGPEMLLGRAGTCDLALLGDATVGKHHARLTLEPEGWVITDLNSRNGTRLNGERVTSEKLRDGDRIRIGAVRLICIIESEPETPQVLLESGLHTERVGQVDLAKAGAPARAAPRLGSGAVLEIVSGAARALLSGQGLSATAEAILGLAMEHVPAERGVLARYDPVTEDIEKVVSRSMTSFSGDSIRMPSSICKEAIENRMAICHRDASHATRFRDQASVQQESVRSFLCAPLIHEGSVLGLIYLDTTSASRGFTQEHLAVLSVLTDLSAVAFGEAHLREVAREANETRARLSRYLAPAVVERVVAAPASGAGEMLIEEREISVLFADICGFTALAEARSPTEVAQLLNGLFAQLTQVVFDFEGTLDKFMGDGLMVFYGAPMDQPDHAERAVRSALRMQERLAAEHTSSELALRIGINTGLAVAADIGSPDRKDYSVLGDMVNVASRLESSVAEAGQIVVGPTTETATRKLFRYEPLGPISLRGRARAVSPFRVLGPA